MRWLRSWWWGEIKAHKKIVTPFKDAPFEINGIPQTVEAVTFHWKGGRRVLIGGSFVREAGPTYFEWLLNGRARFCCYDVEVLCYDARRDVYIARRTSWSWREAFNAVTA
jgi:hypothetical protein